MTTVEIKLSLPESVAKEARAAGLLRSEAIEQLIADALRTKAFDEFLSVAERVEAAGNPPMTTEDLEMEIQAYRQERRRGGG